MFFRPSPGLSLVEWLGINCVCALNFSGCQNPHINVGILLEDPKLVRSLCACFLRVRVRDVRSPEAVWNPTRVLWQVTVLLSVSGVACPLGPGKFGSIAVMAGQVR